MVRLKEGTVITHLPDGTRISELPDGTRVLVFSEDGQHIVEPSSLKSKEKLKTILTERTDGTKTFELADGSIIEEYPPLLSWSNRDHSSKLPHIRQGARSNTISLKEGTLVAKAVRPMTLNLVDSNIYLGAGTLACAVETGADGAVVNLFDTQPHSVKVLVGKKYLTVGSGQQLTVTPNHEVGFDQINPLPHLGYRNVQEIQLDNGMRAFLCDVSLPQAIKTLTPFLRWWHSESQRERRTANHMLKTAAALILVKGSREPFKTSYYQQRH